MAPPRRHYAARLLERRFDALHAVLLQPAPRVIPARLVGVEYRMRPPDNPRAQPHQREPGKRVEQSRMRRPGNPVRAQPGMQGADPRRGAFGSNPKTAAASAEGI